MNNEEQTEGQFKKPTAVDRFFNRAFGFLIRIGIGLSHNYLLEVRGRKTGRVYSTPVNVLEHRGKQYLVAPRGSTQWVRNVTVSGEAALVRGFTRREIRVKPVADDAKPEILKLYLDRYKKTVQRYFAVQADSPLEAFRALAPDYPVFEIIDKR